MTIELTDTTFIIPVRIDTGDRLRNIILTTSYLLYHFNTNVIVKEVDSEHRFEEYALPIIDRLVNTKNLKHIFETDTRTDDAFHRTKVLNDMILESKTKNVVNYDTDIILPLESYVKSVQMLNEEYDVVYPYRFGERGERKVNLDFTIHTQEDMNNFESNDFVKKLIQSNYNSNCFDNTYFYYPNQNGIGWAEYGMVQFFDRQVYIDGYLENEGFIAYAPEDVERHHRWKTLGYKIGRIDNFAYHLEHERTQNSWYNNPHMENNNKLWQYLKNLSRDELINYYENQQYLKDRKK